MTRINPLFIDNVENEPKLYPSQLNKECGLVTRYVCYSDNNAHFGIYVPIPLIARISDFTPQNLNIYIQNTTFLKSSLGIVDSKQEPTINLDYWEYKLYEPVENSIKYIVTWGKAKYSLYVPKIEFSNTNYPDILRLSVKLMN